MNNNKGEGPGGGTPPAQLGGLGERCKLPQWGLGRSPRSQRFLIISCSKHSIKLHENCIIGTVSSKIGLVGL